MFKSRSATEKPQGRGGFLGMFRSSSTKDDAGSDPASPLESPRMPSGTLTGAAVSCPVDAAGSVGAVLPGDVRMGQGKLGQRSRRTLTADTLSSFDPDAFGMKLPSRYSSKKGGWLPSARSTGGPSSGPVGKDDIGWKLPSSRHIGSKEAVRLPSSEAAGDPPEAEAAGTAEGNVGAPVERPTSGANRLARLQAQKQPPPQMSLEVLARLKAWVAKARSDAVDEKREAAKELRLYSKAGATDATVSNVEGGLEALLGLIAAEDATTVELAVTGFLNLSLTPSLRPKLKAGGALPLLVEVLKGGTIRARANAAASIFSLAQTEQEMLKLQKLGVVERLLHMAKENPTLIAEELKEAAMGGSDTSTDSGEARGLDSEVVSSGEGRIATGSGSKANSPRRDAMLAILKLSNCETIRQELVEMDAVPLLVELMNAGNGDVEEEALGVLANVARGESGCKALLKAGVVGILIDVLESGSPLSKEFAVTTMFMLMSARGKYAESVARADPQHLLALVEESGTKKAQKKAQQVIKLLEDHEKSRGPMLLSLKDELMSVTVTDSKVVIL